MYWNYLIGVINRRTLMGDHHLVGDIIARVKLVWFAAIAICYCSTNPAIDHHPSIGSWAALSSPPAPQPRICPRQRSRWKKLKFHSPSQDRRSHEVTRFRISWEALVRRVAPTVNDSHKDGELDHIPHMLLVSLANSSPCFFLALGLTIWWLVPVGGLDHCCFSI